MIPPFDLAAASQAVRALLTEFSLDDAPFMISATLWDHRDGEDRLTVAIYVGLDPGFRREAETLAGALAQIRVELVARFGEVGA